MQILESPQGPAPVTPATEGKGWRPPFNLVRWFSLASFFIIAGVALGLGYISTRFVVEESIERDSMLTAQFVQAIGAAEIRHASISPNRTMGEMLDPRADAAYPDVDPGARAAARVEFLDHVEHLPDILLATVYALDRTVVWSTNPELIGVRIDNDEELDESFEMKAAVSTSYHKIDEERPEQRLLREPQYLFVENYIPMFNADKSKVVAMVEIYKEPVDLVERIQRGFRAIWVTTLLGGAVIYLRIVLDRAACGPAVAQPAETTGGQRNLRRPWGNVLGGRPQPAQPIGEHSLQRRAGPGNRQPDRAEEHRRHHQPGRSHVALGP